MVNGVPREVQRPKPEGPQAPRVSGRGTSRGTPLAMIPPRLFHIMSFFWLPGLVKRDFFHWCQTQPVPRESTGHYTGLRQGILLDLNPNILVRDEERMKSVFFYVASLAPDICHKIPCLSARV